MLKDLAIQKFRFIDSFNRDYLLSVTNPETAKAIGRPSYGNFFKSYKILSDNYRTLSNSHIDFLLLKLRDDFLGTVKVTHTLDERNKLTCEIGIMLAPRMRGRNLGSGIVELICSLIFSLSKDVIIVGGTAATNVQMVRVFEKNSFRQTQGFMKVIGKNGKNPIEVIRFELKCPEVPPKGMSGFDSKSVLPNLALSLSSFS